MANVAFDSNLVVMLDGVSTYQDAERNLANKLVELGYAKDTFPEAIAERESEYPTALDINGINAAMPHCDVAHVIKPAMCVGVLNDPLKWRKMDDTDATCEVFLIVMLALSEAHAHLEMLQKVVGLIQDQELMKKIVSSTSVDAVYELVSEKLI